VDLTLCDLAADAYASTPSAAVERALPDGNEIRRHIRILKGRAGSQLVGRVRQLSSEIGKDLKYIENIINESIARYSRETLFAKKNLYLLVHRFINEYHRSLARAGASLQALSPMSILERGFITCEDRASGKPVTDVAFLRVNEEYILRFRNGYALAQVIRVHPDKTDMEV